MALSTSSAKRIATTTEWLPLSSLTVDPTVQRSLDEGRAARMAENFDPRLLGVPVVSRRKDGTVHVVDGQHRCVAARLAGYGDAKIECKVHEGLSLADEAALFNGLNTFKAPSAFDRFLVRRVEGDPIVLGIDAILMEFGWTPTIGTHDGAFSAVTAAEKVYTGFGTSAKDFGPENLRAVVGTATEAWGRKSSALNGFLVQGLGLFFARYGTGIDKPALVKRLAQYPGGPDNYLGKARGIRDFRGGTLPRCVAELTTDLYNKKRTGAGRLEEWR